MKFSYIDIFLYGGLVVAAYYGYRGGFVKKIFNLLALIASIVIATQLMEPVGSLFIGAGLLSAPTAYVIGFALVIILLMVTAIFLFRRFGGSGVAKSTSQFFGVVIGVIEGSLVISLVLLAFKVFDFPAKSTRDDSLLYKPLVNAAPKTFDLLRSYLPGASSFKEELDRTFHEWNIFDIPSPPGKRL